MTASDAVVANGGKQPDTVRVLQIGAGNLFGGIEVCQLTLAAHRSACPWLEQEYAFCFAGKAAAELTSTGVLVHLLAEVRYSRPWTIISARRALSRLLERRRYDVIVCHEVWVHGIFAPTIRRAGIPLVLWVHDRHGAGGGLEFLTRRSQPDLVIANSRWSAESLPQFLPAVPYHVVYCPVQREAPPPSARRGELRREFGAGDEDVVILQVGRWEPHKGHLVHLDALASIRHIPGWICWQVGAPQRGSERAYFESVRERAAFHGIADRVRFLGWQADLNAVRAAADLYCQPNIRPEPFGLTLVEALYAGLPVIASAEAGPLEIVTADCGVLISPGNTAHLAAALTRLCLEPGLRSHMKAHGPTRASELCDPSQQVSDLAHRLATSANGR